MKQPSSTVFFIGRIHRKLLQASLNPRLLHFLSNVSKLLLMKSFQIMSLTQTQQNTQQHPNRGQCVGRFGVLGRGTPSSWFAKNVSNWGPGTLSYPTLPISAPDAPRFGLLLARDISKRRISCQRYHAWYVFVSAAYKYSSISVCFCPCEWTDRSNLSHATRKRSWCTIGHSKNPRTPVAVLSGHLRHSGLSH